MITLPDEDFTSRMTCQRSEPETGQPSNAEAP